MGELQELEAYQERLQEWLLETEGWDEVPPEAVAEFVRGKRESDGPTNPQLKRLP